MISRRLTVHYLWSLAILTIYGGQVCPFLATLSLGRWFLILAVAFGLMFFFRTLLYSRLIQSAPLDRQAVRVMYLDFGLFFVGSLAVTLYNLIAYSFPFDSGLKVVLGFSTLGFFAAIDLALERERRIADELEASGRELVVSEKFLPLTARFALVASASVIFIVLIFFLIVVRDLSWLAEVTRENYRSAQVALLAEIFFVGVVMLGEILNVIFSYSKNLQRFFSNENQTLESVAGGNLDSKVPVTTNDEFGVMAKYTNVMIGNLRRQTEELERTQDVTIVTLASLAETRDPETGGHILRTQRYVKVLAVYLKDRERFKEELDGKSIELLFKSAPLHDVGKVGIPDAILLKPGPLTDEEFEIMKKHAEFGKRALRNAEKVLGSNSFLRIAAEIAYTHHEKWDGSGYPQGLKGDDIPVSGRLMAIADVYDALISKRVYKEAFSHEKTRNIIVEGIGTHFDPEVGDAFLAIENEFIDIAKQFVDFQETEQPVG